MILLIPGEKEDMVSISAWLLLEQQSTIVSSWTMDGGKGIHHAGRPPKLRWSPTEDKASVSGNGLVPERLGGVPAWMEDTL